MTRSSSVFPSCDEIAVTGYSCRLPGADDADGFWSLMMEGGSAIRQIPSDRFAIDRFFRPGSPSPGKTYVKSAGLIDNVFDFDAAFFGISPREAAQMDPQQRLLLQVAWEAIEHAHLTRDDIRGDRTGVFVAASSCDHMAAAFESPEAMGSTFMTGNTMSVIANRLAYHFDIKGPSSTIDTACSSSLFALHQASLALRSGEIDRAIVGGVNILLSPYPFIGFSRASMLSPDGECRAFDAGANGYVRGEGAVVMVLERASNNAVNKRSRSYLAGIGVNSDGSKAGISLPSVEGQRDLLRHVWRGIDYSPDQIAFVEAHGTGTPVGDPIEANALGQSVSQDRASPLPIGSAKTNIGHLEACSGLVGMLKAQLALERGVLPPSRNYQQPNPDIDFETLNLTVTRDAISLPSEGVLYAGINSFGFGGTNGHAVLRRIEDTPAEVLQTTLPSKLVLTAATEESRSQLAARWKTRLESAKGSEWAELLSASAHSRTRHRYRLVAQGEPSEIIDGLEHAVRGERHAAIVLGDAPDTEGETAFVYCGNGAQWAGMGIDFYAKEASFRDGVDRVASISRSLGYPDPVQMLHLPDLDACLEDGVVAQSLLFAIQVGLTEALRAGGLRPAVTVGHSVGEVTAAWAAGCLNLADACKLIYGRAQAMSELQGSGAMAAVLAGVEQTRAAVADSGLQELEVAGDNSPRSTTISGPADQISAFVKIARQRRLAVQRLPVSYPYHSAAMADVRARMLDLISDIPGQAGSLRFMSTTLGREAVGEELKSDHWWQNARQMVRFREAITNLCQSGASTFVEIGPRPLLQNYIADCAKSAGKRAAVVPSCNRGNAAPNSIDEIVARAVANGAKVESETYFGPAIGSRTSLPAYPWSNKTFVHERSDGFLDLLGHQEGHPLLGHRASEDTWVWQSDIDLQRLPWLADHRVGDAVALPATCYLEIALAALQTLHSGPVEVRDLDLLQPLILGADEAAAKRVRTTLEPETGLLRIESRSFGSSDDWLLHARGVGAKAPSFSENDNKVSLAFLPEWGAEELYRDLSSVGLSYGPSFQRVLRVRAGSGRGSSDLDPSGPQLGMHLDPVLTDAALHGLYPLIMAKLGGTDAPRTLLPARLGRVRLYLPGLRPARAELSLSTVSPLGVSASVTLLSEDGHAIACLEDLKLKPINGGSTGQKIVPFWHEFKLPLTDLDYRPAILKEPTVELDRLGLLDEEVAEMDLLLDAIARRVAWEVLDSKGPDAPGASSLRRVLGQDAETPAQTQTEAPYPPLPTLFEAMLDINPRYSEEILRTLKLRQCLLAETSEASTERVLRPPSSIWSKATQVLDAALGTWPKAAPGRMLLVGDVPSNMPGDLLNRYPEALIAIAGSTRALDERLAVRFQPDPAVHVAGLQDQLEWRCYDMVVLCDIASDFLAWSDELKTNLSKSTSGLLFLETEENAFDLLEALRRGESTFDGRQSLKQISTWFEANELSYQLPTADSGAVFQMLVVETSNSAGLSGLAVPEPVVMLNEHQELKDALARQGARVQYAEAFFAAESSALGYAILPIDPNRAKAVEAIKRYLPHLDKLKALWCVVDAHSASSRDEIEWIKGYLRVLANETTSDVSIHFASLEPGAPLDDFAAAIVSGLKEPEVWVEVNGISASRVAMSERSDIRAPVKHDQTWVLDTERPGLLDSLEWRLAERKRPGPKEVEVQVSATGLNFRDLMWAQRLLPPEALEQGYAGPGLGMECSGLVVRAGQESGICVGERVLTCASNA
ncbi:MAG: beta-ketoacyl synthase N-terminal-like domain-containing protein, partial [Pseudomonadota bacterium]